MRTRLEADTTAAFMHAAMAGGLALGGLVIAGFGAGVSEVTTTISGGFTFLAAGALSANRVKVGLDCLKEKWTHTPN